MAEVRIDFIKVIPFIMNRKTADRIGRRIMRESIRAMRRGLSPVKRFGRFKKYSKPSRYPGKRKGKRPVNLKLSGDLYKSLSWRLKRGRLEYGLLKGKTRGNVDIYGEVHNEGLRKDIAQRKFIPTGRGEEFSKTIMLQVLKILSIRVNNIIKKSNR